jgi:hypothetical protein
MYVTRFQENGFRALATFSEDVDVTTGTVPGVVIEGDSLGSWKEGQVPLRWKDTQAGHGAVWIGWNNRIEGDDTTKRGRPAAFRISVPDSIRRAWEVNGGTTVVFSLSALDQKPGPRTVAKDTTKTRADSAKAKRPAKKATPGKPPKDTLPVELSVEAIDAAGATARLNLGDYGPLRKPIEVTVYRRRGADKRNFASTTELVLQTFVLPLADFARRQPGFDPGRLAAIRFVFDRTEAGTVVLTDLGLSTPDAAFLAGRP